MNSFQTLLTLLLSLAVWAVTLSSNQAIAEDSVEFLSGSKITGKVKEIRKAAKEFDFVATVGSRTVVRTYPFAKVHAVTMNDKRFVLTPMEAAEESTDESGNLQRSKAQIEQLIERVGSSKPDWFDSTETNHPQTLDLKWPLKPQGKWNNRKNMGQYIWDVIHPNESKWRGGIKLVLQCLDLHQGNSTLVNRDMKTVGRMYFELLQDYPRAAYWFRRSGADKGSRNAVMLAECYFRLGNQPMAMQMLAARNYDSGAAAKAIKLYGDMGLWDQAIKMNQRLASTNVAYQGNIVTGDAMQQAGRFDDAIAYYEKVLADNKFRNKEYENRFKARARESIEAIRLFEKVDVANTGEGTYQGTSTGYNGRIDVEVSVKAGTLTAVKVTKHREKQFYSALSDTENSILKLQTVRGVDGTSGATITSRAIVNAAAKALAGARK